MVEELDLSAFESAYRADGRGRPPFHPRMMLALLLYCRCKGIMSGRDVAAACGDDLGARIIMGGQRPNRSTVDRFVRVHEQCGSRRCSRRHSALGMQKGLSMCPVVAGDGEQVAGQRRDGRNGGRGDLAGPDRRVGGSSRPGHCRREGTVGTDVAEPLSPAGGQGTTRCGQARQPQRQTSSTGKAPWECCFAVAGRR